MKWIGRRQSDNVEDRRGMSSGGKTIVGGGVLGIIILLINTYQNGFKKLFKRMIVKTT